MTYNTPAAAAANIDEYIEPNGRKAITGSVLNGTLHAILNATPRTVLSANENYYISSTGSDSTGDGSSGNPWGSLQYAVDWVAANIDGAGLFGITLNVSPGTFPGCTLPGAPSLKYLYILGSISGATIITNNTVAEATRDCIDIENFLGYLFCINTVILQPSINSFCGLFCDVGGQTIYFSDPTGVEYCTIEIDFANGPQFGIYLTGPSYLYSSGGQIYFNHSAIDLVVGDIYGDSGAYISLFSTGLEISLMNSGTYIVAGIFVLESAVVVGGSAEFVSGTCSPGSRLVFLNSHGELRHTGIDPYLINQAGNGWLAIPDQGSVNGFTNIINYYTTPVFGDNLIPPNTWVVINDQTDIRLWANNGTGYVSALLS